MVTVADLEEQTGVQGPHPVLRCSCCGTECSANKNDYFNVRSNFVFRCCKKPMDLVMKRITYEKVG